MKCWCDPEEEGVNPSCPLHGDDASTLVIIKGRMLKNGEPYRPCIGDSEGAACVAAAKKAQDLKLNITKGIEGRAHFISVSLSCPYCGEHKHVRGSGGSSSAARQEADENLFGLDSAGKLMAHLCKCGASYRKKTTLSVEQGNLK